MEYSIKLKKAMQEIDAIMKRYDIGGLVNLHTPGFAEFKAYLTPRYSCIKYMAGGHRIYSKIADYGGDVEKQKKVLADTSNMLSSLVDTSGPQILHVMEMSEKLDAIIGAEHSKGNTSSHEQQNN